MAHWPKTVSGNLLAIMFIGVAALILVTTAIALSGTFVWASLAVLALGCVAVITWRRRALAANDLAVADAPSFADDLRRMHEREALQANTP
jgi:hypothetical protein